MNFWTYMLIGFAVSAVLGYMRKPKATKGQTVALPALMAVIGAIGFLFCVALALWGYKDGSYEAMVGFLVFSLLGGSLIMAYVNCRISYDEKGFTARNFWGITRSYTYDEITWLKGTRDVKLYVGDHVVRIDEMAIGKTEFLCYVESRYMRTHGGRGIPIEPPDGKKGFDLFNGNLENPGEIILIYAMLLGFMAFIFGVLGYHSIPPKAEDLSYAVIQVERYEVEDGTLWLYAQGEELPFDIWGYTTSLVDAEAFLQQCGDNGSFTVGFLSYSEHHKIHYVEDAEGTVYLTMEAAYREEMKNNKEGFLLMGVMTLFVALFLGASIYVGRHPERFSPKIVRLFFKEGYVRMPVNAKKER